MNPLSGCSERVSAVLIEGISVVVGTSERDVLRLAEQRMKRAGFSVGSLHFRLFKRSVDARKREDIRLVYTVMALCADGQSGLSEAKLIRAGLKPYRRGELTVSYGDTVLPARPLVVGMGPAGLFCAYLLRSSSSQQYVIVYPAVPFRRSTA